MELLVWARRDLRILQQLQVTLGSGKRKHSLRRCWWREDRSARRSSVRAPASPGLEQRPHRDEALTAMKPSNVCLGGGGRSTHSRGDRAAQTVLGKRFGKSYVPFFSLIFYRSRLLLATIEKMTKRINDAGVELPGLERGPSVFPFL